MAMSPRNFSRHFRGETGETTAQFTERARPRCKLEQTVVPVETIAEECGFGNAERMRRTFQRLFARRLARDPEFRVMLRAALPKTGSGIPTTSK
jgi:transcriptional regulator GlxA family with amidase domain